MAEDTTETSASASPSEGTPAEATSAKGGPAWLPWLAWGWVALLVLCAVAELSGWDDLRLALDFQRHFR